MSTPKNILCITSNFNRHNSDAVKRLLSTMLSYWDPVDKLEKWEGEICYKFIIEDVKIAIIELPKPYHFHPDALIDAREWGADVIICNAYSYQRCPYNPVEINDLLSDFSIRSGYNITWLSNPIIDSITEDSNNDDSLTDCFVRFIIDIIENKYDIVVSGRCVIDSILVEEGSEMYDKLLSAGNALEFLTYKPFGKTTYIYRLDKGDGREGRQDHIHVYSRKKEPLFSINRDGTPHDGSRYRLTKKQMAALEDLGFKYPKDGILKCLNVTQ